MGFPMADVGAFIKAFDGNASENAAAPSLITAGAGLDNTKVTGVSIDRKSGTALARSSVIATGYLTALDTAETLSLAHEYQDSDDNSTFNTAVVIEAATVKETAAAAGNFRDVDEHDLSLLPLARYFRINVTLDLSRGGTDTALYFTVVMLGGWTQIPQ